MDLSTILRLAVLADELVNVTLPKLAASLKGTLAEKDEQRLQQVLQALRTGNAGKFNTAVTMLQSLADKPPA